LGCTCAIEGRREHDYADGSEWRTHTL